MKKAGWKRKIKKACKEAGTYKPFFDLTIETLATVMEMRDTAQEKFEEMGGETVVEYTNKNGSTNHVKNPALLVVMDCHTQALSYWRELGLTSKSYKQMTGKLDVLDKSSGLDDVLNDLGL